MAGHRPLQTKTKLQLFIAFYSNMAQSIDFAAADRINLQSPVVQIALENTMQNGRLKFLTRFKSIPQSRTEAAQCWKNTMQNHAVNIFSPDPNTTAERPQGAK